MPEYKVYFEAFGRKMVSSEKASNKMQAMLQTLGRINFLKVEEQNDDHADNLDVISKGREILKLLRRRVIEAEIARNNNLNDELHRQPNSMEKLIKINTVELTLSNLYKELLKYPLNDTNSKRNYPNVNDD